MQKLISVVDSTTSVTPIEPTPGTAAKIAVETIPAVNKDTVRAALNALSSEEREAIIQEMGGKPRKTKKTMEDAFNTSLEVLYSAMPKFQETLEGCAFPCAVALTVGIDKDGFFFANAKRIRAKYGPRNGKEVEEPTEEERDAAIHNPG